jgi:hypothetical protein
MSTIKYRVCHSVYVFILIAFCTSFGFGLMFYRLAAPNDLITGLRSHQRLNVT